MRFNRFTGFFNSTWSMEEDIPINFEYWIQIPTTIPKISSIDQSRNRTTDECEDFNPTTLIRAAAALGIRNHVDVWYCDTSDRGMADFITRSRVSLSTTSPPYLDEPTALNSYIAQDRELLMPGRKRLFFSGSLLASRLLEIPASGRVKRTARPQDTPLLMALGGCLAAMITWKFDPDEQRLCDAINQELSIDFDY